MSWIDEEGRIHRDGSPPIPSPTPPPVSHNFRVSQAPNIYCSNRSYLIAGILAIEFGFLGIHNFYIKYYKKGVVQLAFTLGIMYLTSQLVDLIGIKILMISTIAFLGMCIWGAVEGIFIFYGRIDKDGEGNDFWRRWFVHLTSAKYIRPYTYPHIKAWILISLFSLIYIIIIVAPLIGYFAYIYGALLGA